jgi:hypothetical protein
MDDKKLIENLTQVNRACVNRTVPLLNMLGRCKQQFLLYAESHRAKGTPEGDQKAETNAGLAHDIDEAISEFQLSSKEKLSED